MEQPEVSYIAGGSVAMEQPLLENYLAFFKKLNIPIPYNSMPRYLLKRNKSLCPQKKKNLYKNIYSSFIHTSQKLKTAQMSINQVANPYNKILLKNKILFKK